MSDDIDYDSDILRFKQVWGNTQNKLKQYSQQPDHKNLQTIQSNTKNNHKTNNNSKQRQQKSKINYNKNMSENKINQNKSTITKNNQNKKQTKNKQTKTIYSSSTMKNKTKDILRNPRPDKPDQVIQITTQPKQFYQSSLSNQKKNIVHSHLILNGYNHETSNIKQNYVNQDNLQRQLQKKDYELSLLRVKNTKNQDRIKYLQSQIALRDEQIEEMRMRERRFKLKNCDLQSKQFNFDYGKVQYENFKNDSKRLLKMLQATQEYKTFAELAIQDNGVRFLHQVNKTQKSKLDNPKSQMNSIHFCTCNKAFIAESAFWVPEKVYSFGKQFIRNRNGESISESQLQLMLYQLNKIWRQRQKRIINSLSALKGHQISKYKRKIQNMTVNTSREKTQKSPSTYQNVKKGSKYQQQNNEDQNSHSQNQAVQQ